MKKNLTASELRDIMINIEEAQRKDRIAQGLESNHNPFSLQEQIKYLNGKLTELEARLERVEHPEKEIYEFGNPNGE